MARVGRLRLRRARASAIDGDERVERSAARSSRCGRAASASTVDSSSSVLRPRGRRGEPGDGCACDARDLTRSTLRHEVEPVLDRRRDRSGRLRARSASVTLSSRSAQHDVLRVRHRHDAGRCRPPASSLIIAKIASSFAVHLVAPARRRSRCARGARCGGRRRCDERHRRSGMADGRRAEAVRGGDRGDGSCDRVAAERFPDNRTIFSAVAMRDRLS